MLKDFKSLIDWSLKSYHDLPWRKKRSLYTTLVSEIMLQQTTVGTVIKHYDRFLSQFPSLKILGQATEEELLIAWKGLGYYRRAKNLLKASRYLLKNFDGDFPMDRDKLLKVPGIGPYTASALRAIGKDEVDLAVDANLERVLARYYGIKVEKGLKLQKDIYKKFQNQEILSFSRDISFRLLNEALMDLGRVICKTQKVECLLCPLKNNCVAYKNKEQLMIPVVKKTKVNNKKLTELELIRVLYEKKGKILAYKKSDDEWLSGQYEIPTFIKNDKDLSLNQYPKSPHFLKKKEVKSIYKTAITKYKIVNFVVIIDEKERQKLKNYKMLSLDEQKNLSTASFKALKSQEEI